jgi:hypothetical protein
MAPQIAAALRFGAVAATLLGVGACGGPGSDSGDRSCDRDPPLRYDNFGQGFMGKHCAGCHSSLFEGPMRKGAPPGVDLDTYANVVTWAYRVEARATGDAPSMPPGGGPSPTDLARLDEWLQCSVLRDADAQQAQQGGR